MHISWPVLPTADDVSFYVDYAVWLLRNSVPLTWNWVVTHQVTVIAGIFYLLFTPRGWKFAGYMGEIEPELEIPRSELYALQNDWRR